VSGEAWHGLGLWTRSFAHSRRVVAIDLGQLDVLGIQREQRFDVPLLVAALQGVEIERDETFFTAFSVRAGGA
jgi:hypothetical protein